VGCVRANGPQSYEVHEEHLVKTFEALGTKFIFQTVCWKVLIDSPGDRKSLGVHAALPA